MVLDEFVDLSNPSMDLDRQCPLRLHFENFDYCRIIVWVDDMVGIANTKETNDKFVEKLAAK